jgi:mannose-6-phosphate isomerase-like protein (cupin superfamily)
MADTDNKPGMFFNHPFPPDKKRPVHLRGDLIRPYIYPPTHPNGSDLNLLYASTDKLTVGTFQLSPGATFDPPDVHAGDEVYYILDGLLTQQNTELGEFVQVKKGESLYMPKGAYHKSYNFEQGITRMLFVLAPKPWEGQAPPEDELFGAKLKMYKGKDNAQMPGPSNLAEWYRHGTVEDLGSWPVDGPESRKPPIRFYHVPEEKMLIQVHGREKPVLIKFFVSNDWVHVGKYIIPTGGTGPRLSEPDSHAGDLVLFVEKGPITVFLPGSGDVFNVGVEEGMLIPAGVTYQLINYTAETVWAIFAVGPGL